MVFDKVYDFIVLGGGSAGCVLAARLSENPDARVLLVERGRGMSSATRIPAMWPTLLDGAESWPGGTVEQAAVGATVRWPRGRGLGGSSGINGMIFARGHRSRYDQWPSLGARGWGYDDLLPYFRRTERVSHGDPTVRGDAGPMTVAPASPGHPVALAGLAAATEAGYPMAADIGSGLDIGFGRPDLTIVDGERLSAADAYLAPALTRTNLDIATNALVHSVCVVNGRAVGVKFTIADTLFMVGCVEEVVLTAGAVGSAAILLRSGIGPARHLQELGIDIVADIAGVGENLHDHPLSGITYRSHEPLADSTNNHGEVIGVLSSDEGPSPDLQFTVGSAPVHRPSQHGPPHGYTIMVGLMTPYSRGVLRLSSADPESPPLLDPRYLVESDDRTALTTGLHLARCLGEAEAFQPWRAEEALPGIGTGNDLSRYLRQSMSTCYDYVGTCHMGIDDISVVDPDLRVHGISRLRVADASVIPSIPSANIYATVLAIAERAAEFISGRQPCHGAAQSSRQSHGDGVTPTQCERSP
jgi:choline dehydrogenase